jgi:hypothetical protein
LKTATLSGRTIALPIVAYDAANLSIDQLAEVRQHSIERFSASLRPQLLKHSDEQTLAAAVALDRAIAHMRADSHQDFSRWAVISATRYLGRTAFAAVIDKYQIDGPWGVSVQVIPHTSPHALASSLSLALASHGPCLGAGAAPANELEAIVTAATLLEQPEISGAWVVFSGWTDASPMDSEAGSSPHCQAAVLALLPRRAEAMVQPMGAIAIGQKPHRPAEMENSHPRADLLHWLAARHQRDPAFVELASGGMAIRIELTGGPACIKSPPHSEPRLAATSKRRRRLLAAGALTR